MLDTYEKLIQGLLDKGFGSVDNWLSNEEQIGLRKSLLTYHENNFFHLAGVGNRENHQTVIEIRTDQIYWLDPRKANLFEQRFLEKITDFIDYLNRTCFTGINSYEFQYALYQKGSFYKKHIDQFKEDNKRQFSIVFYLTEDWDREIKKSIMKLFDVEQPLMPFVDEKTRGELDELFNDPNNYKSVYALKYNI